MTAETPCKLVRTYGYRLYPTKAQAAELNSQIDNACTLYNAALQERKYAWKYGQKSIGFHEQYSQLKSIREDETLGIPNFGVAAEVLKRVDRAFKAYYRRVKAHEGKVGYPRFRSSKRYDSITFKISNGGFRLRNDKHLYLQGTGEVKIKLHRPLDGQIKTVCIKRQSGKWLVYFATQCIAKQLPKSTEAIGIDVGLTKFATFSNGTEISNPRYYKNSQRKLRVAERRKSRRKKGSNGRRKAVRLLQKIHARISNQRSDFQHKVSRGLINRYGLIVIEDLNLVALSRSMLAKSVHDAAWGSFFNKLSYKAEDAGRMFVKVNPRNTTQMCSGCGTIVKKDLDERRHKCKNCGLNIDRDHNAALNILRLGASRTGLTWNMSSSVPVEAHQG